MAGAPGHRAVDEHVRHRVAGERLEQAVLGPRGRDQQPVDAAALDELGERLVGLLVLEVLGAQQHVAALARAPVGAADDLHVGRVGEVGHEQRERAGGGHGERAGDGMRAVAELLRERAHALAGLVAHRQRRVAAEHPRDRRLRHPRGVGDVLRARAPVMRTTARLRSLGGSGILRM